MLKLTDAPRVSRECRISILMHSRGIYLNQKLLLLVPIILCISEGLTALGLGGVDVLETICRSTTPIVDAKPTHQSS